MQTNPLHQKVGGDLAVSIYVCFCLFAHGIIIKVKSMLLSGLFGLAIKQYHRKGILFHFLCNFIPGGNYPRPSRSDFVLLKGVNRKFCAKKGSTGECSQPVEP